MKQAAISDPNCIPNTITYSSLISACAAGSRLDKALQVYDEMQEAGLQPDHITYSTLISAYEKAGELAEALALLDRLHEAGGAASSDTYVKVMQYLAGKQLWNRALEVFLELQAAGELCFLIPSARYQGPAALPTCRGHNCLVIFVSLKLHDQLSCSSV